MLYLCRGNWTLINLLDIKFSCVNVECGPHQTLPPYCRLRGHWVRDCLSGSSVTSDVSCPLFCRRKKCFGQTFPQFALALFFFFFFFLRDWDISSLWIITQCLQRRLLAKNATQETLLSSANCTGANNIINFRKKKCHENLLFFSFRSWKRRRGSFVIALNFKLTSGDSIELQVDVGRNNRWSFPRKNTP